LNILDAFERRLDKVPRITLREILALGVAIRPPVNLNPPNFLWSCGKPNRHNMVGTLCGSNTGIRGGAASEAGIGQKI
jgi:hypothetical protein